MRLNKQIFEKPLFRGTYTSPIGDLCLLARENALVAVLWPKEIQDPQEAPMFNSIPEKDTAILEQTKKELDAYFSKKRQTFSIPIEFCGTVFQTKVWQSLLTIPYGQTQTYGWQAKAIDHPTAYRAVGSSNGRNPLSIVVPCHRVVGQDGSLTGFAGGLKVKKFLLELEGGVVEAPSHN